MEHMKNAIVWALMTNISCLEYSFNKISGVESSWKIEDDSSAAVCTVLMITLILSDITALNHFNVLL